jgi:hypothetical protein
VCMRECAAHLLASLQARWKCVIVIARLCARNVAGDRRHSPHTNFTLSKVTSMNALTTSNMNYYCKLSTMFFGVRVLSMCVVDAMCNSIFSHFLVCAYRCTTRHAFTGLACTQQRWIAHATGTVDPSTFRRRGAVYVSSTHDEVCPRTREELHTRR